mgnify:CR=1 FL=1
MDVNYISNNYLSPFIKEKYNSFLKKSNSLFYHKLEYINFLCDILGSESKLYLFFDNQEIVASVPFIFKESEYGIVYNSLPFFGSIGDFLLLDEYINQEHVYRKVFIDVVLDILSNDDTIAVTFISNPFSQFSILKLINDILSQINDRLKMNYKIFWDMRLLYLSFLFFEDNFEGNFKKMVKDSTVRNINKAKRLGIKILKDKSKLNFLKEIHYENILKIGGKNKPEKFFSMLDNYFTFSVDYDLYIGYLDNQQIAALLVMYHKNFIEYFKPAIKEEYRNTQVLSYIIYNCMEEAWRKGYRIWNWGGTHLEQLILMRFKKKWANNLSYYYYITFFNLKKYELLLSNFKDVIKIFNFYYIIPYRYLKT